MNVLCEPSFNQRAFHDWREALPSLERKQQRFDEWLFLNAASVLEELALGETEVEANLQRLSEMWGFRFRLLFVSNGRLKLIVYQADRLQAVLDDAPFCIMGAKLNYRYPLRAEDFIDELRERWQE